MRRGGGPGAPGAGAVTGSTIPRRATLPRSASSARNARTREFGRCSPGSDTESARVSNPALTAAGAYRGTMEGRLRGIAPLVRCGGFCVTAHKRHPTCPAPARARGPALGPGSAASSTSTRLLGNGERGRGPVLGSCSRATASPHEQPRDPGTRRRCGVTNLDNHRVYTGKVVGYSVTQDVAVDPASARLGPDGGEPARRTRRSVRVGGSRSTPTAMPRAQAVPRARAARSSGVGRTRSPASAARTARRRR